MSEGGGLRDELDEEEASVSRIVGMGFGRELAVGTLRATGGDVVRAVDVLLRGSGGGDEKSDETEAETQRGSAHAVDDNNAADDNSRDAKGNSSGRGSVRVGDLEQRKFKPRSQVLNFEPVFDQVFAARRQQAATDEKREADGSSPPPPSFSTTYTGGVVRSIRRGRAVNPVETPVDPSLLRQLGEMGFDPSQAAEALQASSNDPVMAVGLLTGGGTFESRFEASTGDGLPPTPVIQGDPVVEEAHSGLEPNPEQNPLHNPLTQVPHTIERTTEKRTITMMCTHGCGKAFSSKVRLEKHIRKMHTGSRPLNRAKAPKTGLGNAITGTAVTITPANDGEKKSDKAAAYDGVPTASSVRRPSRVVRAPEPLPIIAQLEDQELSEELKIERLSDVSKWLVNDNSYAEKVATAGTIPVLVAILRGPSQEALKKECAKVLRQLTMARGKDYDKTAASAGALEILVELMTEKDASDEFKELCASALSSVIAGDPLYQETAAGAGALKLAFSNLEDTASSPDLKTACVKLMWFLMRDNEENAKWAAAAGGDALLRRLCDRKDMAQHLRDYARPALQIMRTHVRSAKLAKKKPTSDARAKMHSPFTTNSLTVEEWRQRLGKANVKKVPGKAHNSGAKFILGDRALVDEGLARLAEALRGNNFVKELNLSNCAFGNQGLHALGRALRGNTTLEVLSVKGNASVSELEGLLEAGELTTLRSLDASWCNLTAVPGQLLQNLPNLKWLGLGYNKAEMLTLPAELGQLSPACEVDLSHTRANKVQIAWPRHDGGQDHLVLPSEEMSVQKIRFRAIGGIDEAWRDKFDISNFLPEKELAGSSSSKGKKSAEDPRGRKIEEATLASGDHGTATKSDFLSKDLLKFGIKIHSEVDEQSQRIRQSEFLVHREEVLGRGAFSVVFRGDLNGLPVAVKELLRDPDDSFVSEATQLAEASKCHENVVRFLGVGKLRDNKLALLLQYCDLGSLERNLLEHKTPGVSSPIRWTSDLLLSVAEKVASALASVHTLAIWHRDIAARNILLRGNPSSFEPLLSDFGLARNVSRASGYAYKVESTASPARSTAPEVHRERIFVAASDIFAMGMLLWEMWSFCDDPFPGRTDDLVVQRVLQVTDEQPILPPPTSRCDCPCPDKVYGIMLDCWKLRCEDRPTAKEVSGSLKDILMSRRPDSKPSWYEEFRPWRAPLEQNASPNKYDFFFSHSGIDKMEVVRVVQFLRAQRFRIFFDLTAITRHLIKHKILEGLASSRRLLAWLSPGFFRSKWACLEFWSFLAWRLADNDGDITKDVPLSMFTLELSLGAGHDNSMREMGPEVNPSDIGYEADISPLGGVISNWKANRYLKRPLDAAALITMSRQLFDDLDRPSHVSLLEKREAAEELLRTIDHDIARWSTDHDDIGKVPPRSLEERSKHYRKLVRIALEPDSSDDDSIG